MTATCGRTSGVRRVWRREASERPNLARQAALSTGADRLGQPQSEHWRSIPRWTALSMVAVAVFVGVVAMIVLAVYVPPARRLAVALAAGALVLLAAYAVYRITARGPVTGVVIFERGIVVVYGRRPIVVPWPKVLTVRRQITEYPDRGGQASRIRPTKFDIALDCEGLAPLHLSEEFQDIGVLDERIESEVVRHRLDETVRLVKAGETVSFGPLAVGPQGIDNGRSILSWDQVLDVRVTAGRVIVLEDSPLLSWCDHRVRDIPNLAIFLALVRSQTGEGDWPDGG
jgi:Family of unknown function (DUF6585)